MSQHNVSVELLVPAHYVPRGQGTFRCPTCGSGSFVGELDPPARPRPAIQLLQVDINPTSLG